VLCVAPWWKTFRHGRTWLENFPLGEHFIAFFMMLKFDNTFELLNSEALDLVSGCEWHWIASVGLCTSEWPLHHSWCKVDDCHLSRKENSLFQPPRRSCNYSRIVRFFLPTTSSFYFVSLISFIGWFLFIHIISQYNTHTLSLHILIFCSPDADIFKNITLWLHWHFLKIANIFLSMFHHRVPHLWGCILYKRFTYMMWIIRSWCKSTRDKNKVVLWFVRVSEEPIKISFYLDLKVPFVLNNHILFHYRISHSWWLFTYSSHCRFIDVFMASTKWKSLA
jgi:hypothetical protein